MVGGVTACPGKLEGAAGSLQGLGEAHAHPGVMPEQSWRVLQPQDRRTEGCSIF